MSLESAACPNCGAEVDFSGDLIGQACAFCDSPLLEQKDVDRPPVHGVAPFVLDRVAAATRLQQRLQQSRMAPEAVRSAVRPEELVGVLVPFWCYDADARSDYQADLGIHWYETVTYTVTVNGKTQVRTKQVRRTEWHELSGSHVHRYRDHLVSGSRGISEPEANELEPFDLGRLRDFEPALVAGNVAERPTVDHEAARQVAAQELANLENAAIARFLPGDEVRNVRNQTSTHVGQVKLILLPVWVSNWSHKDRVFRLLVNGQTGEVVGQVPRSGLKIFLLVLALLTVLGLLVLVAMS